MTMSQALTGYLLFNSMDGIREKRYTIKGSELLIILYVLHIIRFYNFLPYTYLHNITYAIDILFASFFFFCFLIDNHKFGHTKLEIATTILYVVFLCAIPIGLKNGQQIDRVLKYTSMLFLQFGFFYYLKRNRVNSVFLIKLLQYLLIGYVLVSLVCYLQYPNMIFGGDDEQSLARMQSSLEDRGIIRVTLPCKMLITLFLFIEIQNFRFSYRVGIRILSLLILLLLMGNRFPIVVTVLVAALMVFRSSLFSFKNKIYITAGVGVLMLILMIIPSTRRIFDSLVQTTIEEGSYGSEHNVRVLSATYFFTEFNEGNLEACIIGNGVNSNGFDSYSQRIRTLNEDMGFWEGDVGYCEIYIYFGIVGLIALAYWCFAVYNLKIEKKYNYIKYYFLFLMLAMICGGYWFENFYIVSILTYLMVESNKRKCITEKCSL